MPSHKRLFIFSAPSGAGKTTITQHLLKRFPSLCFSISATTRNQRPGEVHGKNYYFLSREEFERSIANGELAEYEEIFGNLYGTLKSEIQRALDDGKYLVFDVDVKGALALRRAFPDNSLMIFIAPPDVDKLRERLSARNTESEEQLRMRLARVEMEMERQNEFDIIIINDDLETALTEAEEVIAAHGLQRTA
jgi:guanylate kinase